jgi:hypothetical protein
MERDAAHRIQQKPQRSIPRDDGILGRSKLFPIYTLERTTYRSLYLYRTTITPEVGTTIPGMDTLQWEDE